MGLDIRDVADHYSDVADCRDTDRRTFFYANDCNQLINVQVQASEDESFTNVFNVGTVQSVGAGTRISQLISDYYPYMRIRATAAVAPTSGTFNAWIAKLR